MGIHARTKLTSTTLSATELRSGEDRSVTESTDDRSRLSTGGELTAGWGEEPVPHEAPPLLGSLLWREEAECGAGGHGEEEEEQSPRVASFDEEEEQETGSCCSTTSNPPGLTESNGCGQLPE